MAITTRKVFLRPTFAEDGSAPYIEDALGTVGGILRTDDVTGDKKLIVFDLTENIDWKKQSSKIRLEGYIYNKNLDIWGKFKPNYYKNGSQMTIDNSDYVNSETGVPCLPTELKAIPTFRFWFIKMGKAMIDAMQSDLMFRMSNE